VHHAYSKHAEVTVPSLDEWEKEWAAQSAELVVRSGERREKKLVPVDFRSQQVAPSDMNADSSLVSIAQSN